MTDIWREATTVFLECGHVVEPEDVRLTAGPFGVRLEVQCAQCGIDAPDDEDEGLA